MHRAYACALVLSAGGSYLTRMVTTVPHLFLGPTAREAATARARELLQASPEAHVDCRELLAEGEAQIGIDEVRQALLWSRYGPVQGSWKVILVGPAERLSREATSALLKSLEEAPPYLAFLLHAGGPEHLPDTIRSRCVARWTPPRWSEKLDQGSLSSMPIEEKELIEELLESPDQPEVDLVGTKPGPHERWQALLSELNAQSVADLATAWTDTAGDPLRARAIVWSVADQLVESPVEEVLQLAKAIGSGGKSSCQRFFHHLLYYQRRGAKGALNPSWARKVSLAWGELQANANPQLLLEVVLLWPKRG